MVDPSFLKELTVQAGHDRVQQCVVGAVVRRGDAILLLQRHADDFMGGIYELPSGKVEPGETLDVALTREVTEETGLSVTAIPHYLGSFDYTSARGNKSRQLNFAVDVSATEPVVLQEHDAFAWIALDEIPPVTDAVKDVLSNYRSLVSS